MKALLLTAGLGTRLQPFTFFQAKATLPLFDVPFIHYPLQYLKRNGVTDVVINLHAHPDSVKNVVSQFQGMNIEYSFEPEILGTAGAIRKASAMLGSDPFIVLNGDMLTAIPLNEVVKQHRESDSDVTLVVMKNDAFVRYSGLYFAGSDRLTLTGFQEGEGEKYHYTGLQIVSPRIISSIPADRPSEVFRDVYPQIIRSGKIQGFVYEGFWREIGTLKEYLETSLHLRNEQLPVELCPPGMQQGLISRKASVEGEAVVIDSIVMDRATIRRGCSIRRCIIGSNTTVDKDWEGVALAHGVLPWYIFVEQKNR